MDEALSLFSLNKSFLAQKELVQRPDAVVILLTFFCILLVSDTDNLKKSVLIV